MAPFSPHAETIVHSRPAESSSVHLFPLVRGGRLHSLLTSARMSYLLINEDGTAQYLNDAAAPMDPRLSDNDNDNDDDDFEQLYVEARESSSPGSDYVQVECKADSDSSPNSTTQIRFEESYAELTDEYPSSYIAVSSDDEKLVAEYDVIANHYCDDSQYRNQYLTTKLQSAYENILSKDINNNETVIGYISVLIGQVTQELAKTNSYSVLYSDELTDALMRYDIFLKMLDETDISEEVQIYAKGRYYQCIGDVMSARFAARDHNEENRWVLINYAMCAYSVAMNYLKNLTIKRGIIDAYLKVVRCEIKICLDYALSYYDMIDGVKESLSDKTFGSELSVELYAKLEDEEDECLVSESFLATNDEDVYGSENLDEHFNFSTDFVDYAAEIWNLRDTHNFLDHLLFIIGYSKPYNYDFVPTFFPNLKPGPLPSTELSVIETFLVIVSMAIEFCQVPCNQFGYDYLYRKRMELPEIEHHSTGDSDAERAIILPVSRHERHGHVKTLIWKALLEIGQDPEELQPSEIYSSKRMLSEMIKKIKTEIHVTEALHNGYIVSERFHLMLNWYHDRESLDRESKILLNSHLKYLRRRLPFKPSRDAIREASKTGDILTQKFPDLHLEWLFYPIGSSCECVHVPNVYELIDYINIFAYERGSAKYKELTAKLSPSFQAVMAEKELKANEVPGKPFSDEFLAKSKALEEECNALKREIGYSIPEHLSWDRIREVAQSSGQKLGHTKYQAAYKALSMEMRELTLFYRAETARNMKPQPPLVVPDLPHHIELRKTCALFCEVLENHGKWMCEKIRSIRRREEESRIRLYSIIYAPDFPYTELLDVAKFAQDPLNIPPPDHLEATLKMSWRE
uniref:TPR_REGION domain-containing protein n=1 Tax=Panagrellus redivivus TaxID=6233 RepID=A0A7E4VCB6_PANRE